MAKSPCYIEGMAQHLIKLCVGAESIDDLERWIAQRRKAAEKRGVAYEQFHTTRQTPRRGEEILDGGSLYWVIRGAIQCRQRILELRPVTGDDGISRCKIVLEPVIVPVAPRPRRPFQGWRYLTADDAPPDLGETARSADIPVEMRRELANLGLI